jgi:two-component system, chemotaxis family, sensor histidine kinase and response regulator PixL
MDNDNQIPFKFLDEAEDCCDRMEATVLGLANKVADPQELDNALRAAHSVKGGAAMMGFNILSHVAHHLEDYFKILRVRYHSKSINTETETWLLQGVDGLRQAINCYRQGQSINEQWFVTQSQPIFDRLRQQLGDLRPEDEDALLSQEGDVDPALLLFEGGVNEALNYLDGQIEKLSPAQLLQELATTAAELSDFGRMAKLERFIELCASVKSYSETIDVSQSIALTRQSLKIWRRSHSVVLLRRFEKIPTELPGLPTNQDLGIPEEKFPEDSFNPALAGMEGLIGSPSLDLSILQSEIADLDIFGKGEKESLALFDETLLLGELATFELPAPPAEFGTNWENGEQQPDITDFFFTNQPSLELLGELAALEMPELPLMEGDNDRSTGDITTTAEAISAVPSAAPTQTKVAANQETVRVPVEYLQQFNNVIGKLILERNAIDLRLAEIHGYTGLLRKRMRHLELSNQELRQWYDRAATEGLIPTAEEAQFDIPAPARSLSSRTSAPTEFDLLEMDRYGDLHLVAQEQIETIVQLQEVAADIELSLRGMTQSVRSLNQTTRVLQVNVTRTQMVPFADVAKRFPRLIRDLSAQFNKPVKIEILGENTGIDRAILDRLSDPLIHLLRNAFDHGIEDRETRLAANKPAQGNITIAASQRSAETLITITDDGGGIRLDRIRDRLQQTGLPSETVSNMTEAELLDTIFEPGFSTATSLTELSGRGVGMDVVRTNIAEVKGTIRVTTQAGVGTTFVIRVPYTLSIVRVMLLERAGFVFAVSVDSVREIISFQPDILTADGRNIAWQSQVIPLMALEQGISYSRSHRTLELPGNPIINKPTILIVGEDKVAVSFQIDRYWGEQEVTMRLIDSLTPLTPGFGNSIILGDGRVVPMVDLLRWAEWMSTNSVTVAANTPRPAVAHPTENHRILVIDDSINVRHYLAAMLEKEGYQVEQAKDGQEAVDKLFNGLVVQAAICDMEMPRLDGYGVLEALRASEQFEQLPILMLTSRSSNKHRQLAMNLGASAYFSKPYNESELLAQLSTSIAMFAGR